MKRLICLLLATTVTLSNNVFAEYFSLPIKDNNKQFSYTTSDLSVEFNELLKKFEQQLKTVDEIKAQVSEETAEIQMNNTGATGGTKSRKLQTIDELYRLDEKFVDYYYGKKPITELLGKLDGTLFMRDTSNKTCLTTTMDLLAVKIERELPNMRGFDLASFVTLNTYENGGNPSICNFNMYPPDLPYYHSFKSGSLINPGTALKDKTNQGYGWDTLAGINTYFSFPSFVTAYQIAKTQGKVTTRQLVDYLSSVSGTCGNYVSSNFGTENSKNVKEILKVKWKCDDSFLVKVFDTLIMNAGPNNYINVSNPNVKALFEEVKAKWGVSGDIPCSNFKDKLGTTIQNAQFKQINGDIDWNQNYELCDFALDANNMGVAIGSSPDEIRLFVNYAKFELYLTQMSQLLASKSYSELNITQKSMLQMYPIAAHGGLSGANTQAILTITEDTSIKDAYNTCYGDMNNNYLSAWPTEFYHAAGLFSLPPEKITDNYFTCVGNWGAHGKSICAIYKRHKGD